MTIASLKSLLIGVGGSLLLAAFCSTFITTEKVMFLMPLFVAFNGAVTGYKVVETLKNRIMNIPLFSFILGVGSGAITFVAVNFAGSLIKIGLMFDIYDLLIYIVVSGITSYLGAKLAVRYFNL
jgi:hypothetical protein